MLRVQAPHCWGVWMAYLLFTVILAALCCPCSGSHQYTPVSFMGKQLVLHVDLVFDVQPAGQSDSLSDSFSVIHLSAHPVAMSCASQLREKAWDSNITVLLGLPTSWAGGDRPEQRMNTGGLKTHSETLSMDKYKSSSGSISWNSDSRNKSLTRDPERKRRTVAGSIGWLSSFSSARASVVKRRGTWSVQASSYSAAVWEELHREMSTSICQVRHILSVGYESEPKELPAFKGIIGFTA